MVNKIFRGLKNKTTVLLIEYLLLCILISIAAFDLDGTNIFVLSIIILWGIWTLSYVLKLKSNNWSIVKSLEIYVSKKNKSKNLIYKDLLLDSLMLCFYLSMMGLLIHLDEDSRIIVGQITLLLAILGIIFFLVYTTGASAQERERAQIVVENMRQIMEADNERNRAVVADLFRRQFEAVDRFAAMRYECSDDRKLSANYGREALKLVKNLAPDSAELSKLEEYINSQRDNLMVRLDETFPQLTATERLIFMYAVIGLSPRAMSVLLDINIESIYNRKSRLKTKLKSGPAEFVEAFGG